MIIHWWRSKPQNWVVKAIINFIGAFISAVLVITLFATRIEHVWPYLFIMPMILFMFLKIKHHYMSIGKQLRLAICLKMIMLSVTITTAQQLLF